jgi:peroxiredoxin
MLRRVRARVLVATALVWLGLGCGEGTSDAAPTAPVPAPAAQAPAPAAKTPAPAARSERERPLPAFSGRTLDGATLSSSDLLGRRLVLFFFDPEAEAAAPAAQALAVLARLRTTHNFEIVGVAAAKSRETLDAFVAAHALDFRIFDDSRREIVQKLGLRVPVAVVGVDGEGYVSFATMSFPTDVPDPAAAAESELRERLRLPALGESLEPVLGERPPAPDFLAERLEGGAPFDSTSLRGRAAVLIFFLHTCPHCHHALAALKTDLAALPEAQRPALVGVSLVNHPTDVRKAMAEDGLDFFPILFDADSRIRTAYGATAGVPDIFLLDADGRVTARVRGWRDDRDPPLMRMRLAKLAGAPVPMLLHQSGFSGNEFCGVCHEPEQQTWELTKHAAAFDTLVEHGADRNAECVSCHVVGLGQPGGFVLTGGTPQFEDVGCESCHGRGGPHLSPGFVKDGDYAPRCVTCHDAKHSLGFEYATFAPKVSHAANAHLLALSVEEKRRVLAEAAKLRADLLPTDARYVGSDACRSCHAAEWETWSKQPHANALASLAAKQQAGNADCLRCHTTAYGLPGGFPAGAAPDDHADLARVGCESCHGPGEKHVADGSRKLGTIVSLGDKCDSCVILQICGACHDDQNDAGFTFRVQERIERQRHGTIEAGTGKPKAPQAALPSAAVVGLLERAFAEPAPPPRS